MVVVAVVVVMLVVVLKPATSHVLQTHLLRSANATGVSPARKSINPCMAQLAVDSPGCTRALNTMACRLRPGGSATGEVIVSTSHLEFESG